MASSIVKRVASNLTRARVMASPCRFYNFQFDKRDSEDVCTLKCDSKPGSVAHHAVNFAFRPHVSPTENLRGILNVVDMSNVIKYGMHKVPWWYVEEDDKSLCLLRALPSQRAEHPSEIHVSESEKPIRPKEFMFAIHPNDEKRQEMNMSVLLHSMRDAMEQSKPSEYYFHVMHDASELPRLAIPMNGKTRGVSFAFNVSYNLQNPQAIRIMLGVAGQDAAGQETDDPFQGYAFEIFLPEGLFNVQEAKQYQTSDLWKIRIPKNKGERVQSIGGNFLCFYTKEICKPSLWRPT